MDGKKKTRKQLTSKEYEAQKSSSGREEDWSKESRVCGKLESLAQKLPSHWSVRKFPSLPPIKRIHRVPVCVGLQCNTVTNSTLVTRIIGFVPLLCSSTAPLLAGVFNRGGFVPAAENIPGERAHNPPNTSTGHGSGYHPPQLSSDRPYA